MLLYFPMLFFVWLASNRTKAHGKKCLALSITAHELNTYSIPEKSPLPLIFDASFLLAEYSSFFNTARMNERKQLINPVQENDTDFEGNVAFHQIDSKKKKKMPTTSEI